MNSDAANTLLIFWHAFVPGLKFLGWVLVGAIAFAIAVGWAQRRHR